MSSSRGLFEAVVIRNDRADYAKTMRCWLEKLRSQKNALTEEFGAPHIATFEKYLSLMIVSFHTGTMNLSRIAFKRIGN
ncbi:class I SAM-dependent methyltransferase [Burkholderia cenocepacia]|uniref:class I SAM-dependent methyltransferase n=1 Tax=Burkholderia cenocepacia TaxID=95486 RepID=UPI003D768694